MNLHFSPQKIYFSRHGQSIYNTEDRVGGDCDLSEKGYKYASKLNEFMQNQFNEEEKSQLKFLTSTLKRAFITSNFVKLGVEPERLRPLDEIATGICKIINPLSPSYFSHKFLPPPSLTTPPRRRHDLQRN